MLFQETKLNNAMQLERFERHLTNEVGLGHYKLFVNERLKYAINMVATSERHVLPKAIPYHRSQRSPSSEGRGGRYSRPGSLGRNVKTMVVKESGSADQKKVRFPPPKNWNPDAKWTQNCVMFKEYIAIMAHVSDQEIGWNLWQL